MSKNLNMCKHGFTFILIAHLVLLRFGKIGCKHAHVNYFLSNCIKESGGLALYVLNGTKLITLKIKYFMITDKFSLEVFRYYL